MASPTVYKWTDTDAPQIQRNNPASYQALFQACLIDGYGDQLPPVDGLNKWTIPFSDATGFILKQGGTQERKTCIKIFGFNSAGTYADVDCAGDFTDFNTPVDQWAGSGVNDHLPVGFANNTTNNIPWIIFATERTIICQFGYNTQQTDSVLFDTNSTNTTLNNYHWYFGDYIPESPELNVNQMVTFTNSTTTSSNTFNRCFTGTSVTTHVRRCAGNAGNLLGQFTIVPMSTRSINNSAFTIGVGSTDEFRPSYPNLVNGGLYLERVRLISQRTILGEWSGILYPLQSRPFPMNGSIYEIDGTGEYAGETIYVFGAGDGLYFVRDGEWGVD